MQRYIFLILLLFLTGCGQIKISGKVTFPDGLPLTTGRVIFANETNNYSGTIQQDGSFRVGMLKDGQGIPRGKYKVAVVDAITEEFPGPRKPPIVTYLVAQKFRSPTTSGIEYDIRKNTTNISIVVEHHKK
ncbi:MAG: hypothetical protein LBU34_13020 [Planctomycetaceae bacterium]|jgi:hypothetical protein|nr:hypothetical protein [Planctomycetaceae bacterium]